MFDRKANKLCLQMVEEGNIINTKTMRHEIEQEIDREDDNLYKRMILNKVYKDENRIMQMENWSILSDKLRYVQHDKKIQPKLDLNTLDYCQHKELYC